jgi:hypothetical protein
MLRRFDTCIPTTPNAQNISFRGENAEESRRRSPTDFSTDFQIAQNTATATIVWHPLLPTMVSKKYTANQKVSMVRTLEKPQSDNSSTSGRAVPRDLGVDASQIRKWQNDILAQNLCSMLGEEVRVLLFDTDFKHPNYLLVNASRIYTRINVVVHHECTDWYRKNNTTKVSNNRRGILQDDKRTIQKGNKIVFWC